jgi:hypothetical protein
MTTNDKRLVLIVFISLMLDGKDGLVTIVPFAMYLFEAL